MVQTTRLLLNAPPPFNFRASARAHGWIDLSPTSWQEESQTVRRVEQLQTDRVILLEMTGADTADQPQIAIQASHPGALAEAEQAEIRAAITHSFRLDEDFSEFYALCHTQGRHWARLTAGYGRLLRSPTLFEDVVKTICTTNIQWSGTKRLVTNLVETLGEPYLADPALRAFPTPEAIAVAAPALFTETIRLGYRGEYVRQLGERVASGNLDLEALRDPSIPSPDLKKRLLAIKGVGPYAAHTLMMILGRYEELAIDTEMRAFVKQNYFNGRDPTDKEIQAIYEGWGRWKYLAYWFDEPAD